MEPDARLREAMVSRLERAGLLRRPGLAAAMRAVPRHRFLPGLPLADAYEDRAIATKSCGGDVLSSISQPAMLAQMLGLLAADPGDRILEIGTGSGYFAALLSVVAAPGPVTTVELDAELAAAARARLAELGYAGVEVVAGDGSAPPAGPPYDRVVVSARADDVAAAWWSSIREGGRLVVPLRLEEAGEYAVGFELRGNRLVSAGLHPCAFVALRGAGAAAGQAELFYRDPGARGRRAHVLGVESVVAVRRADATPDLLARADLVIARPVSLFGVTFRAT